MARRLVTVARFDIPANAHITRNALEAAGIRSVIQDEQLVAMDYLLNLAVGGIKVQVWEEDAGPAAEVLAGLETAAPVGETQEPPGPREGGLAHEAEANGSEEPADDKPAAITRQSDNARDRYARRALVASLCSLLVAPVVFYTAYLLLMTAFSDGTLSPERRWGVWVAGLMTPVVMLLSPWWVYLVAKTMLGS
jgi:hypothetical protein